MKWSSPGRLLPALLPFLLASAVAAQQSAPILVATDLVKDSSGAVLARLAPGTPLVRGRVKGTLQEVTIEGWVAAAVMKDDPRGSGTTVNSTDGTPIRAGAGDGGTLGTAWNGMRFTRLETKWGWAHVRRAAWVNRAAFTAPPKAAPKPAATRRRRRRPRPR